MSKYPTFVSLLNFGAYFLAFGIAPSILALWRSSLVFFISAATSFFFLWTNVSLRTTEDQLSQSVQLLAVPKRQQKNSPHLLMFFITLRRARISATSLYSSLYLSASSRELFRFLSAASDSQTQWWKNLFSEVSSSSFAFSRICFPFRSSFCAASPAFFSFASSTWPSISFFCLFKLLCVLENNQPCFPAPYTEPSAHWAPSSSCWTWFSSLPSPPAADRKRIKKSSRIRKSPEASWLSARHRGFVSQ